VEKLARIAEGAAAIARPVSADHHRVVLAAAVVRIVDVLAAWDHEEGVLLGDEGCVVGFAMHVLRLPSPEKG